MSKKVLIVGGGGREHALAWKLSQSPHVSKIYVAPGNAGTGLVGKNVDIAFTDVNKLLDFAKKNKIDLTVIGQEAASEAGVADEFARAGLKIFGPSKSASLIETSKTFSKNLMRAQNIPTSKFKNFDDSGEALNYLKSKKFPQVIKADGLAAGKGVTICYNLAEAEKVISEIMIKRKFGAAGNKVVIEDFLDGQEVSIHVLSDGRNYQIFPPSQDHKQIYDGDKGPNTGGMGAVAPVNLINRKQAKIIEDQVVKPALEGLAAKGSEFVGCLYPGLMTKDGDVNVVEFNARFGDPEAEVYMRLLDSDLYEILYSCVQGNLRALKWKKGYAVSVVLASAGYPASSRQGDIISGIEDAEKLKDIVVFHAGTKKVNNHFVTASGRVLNVTATGRTLDEALAKAYAAAETISFVGMHYRTDIGKRPH